MFVCSLNPLQVWSCISAPCMPQAMGKSLLEIMQEKKRTFQEKTRVTSGDHAGEEAGLPSSSAKTEAVSPATLIAVKREPFGDELQNKKCATKSEVHVPPESMAVATSGDAVDPLVSDPGARRSIPSGGSSKDREDGLFRDRAERKRKWAQFMGTFQPSSASRSERVERCPDALRPRITDTASQVWWFPLWVQAGGRWGAVVPGDAVGD